MRVFLVSILLLSATPLRAQDQEVNRPVDYTSYVSAVVVPSIAFIKALKSEHKLCNLGQLGISELVGNGTTLIMKHFIKSERPCIGCAPDGMPSGHSMNGWIGAKTAGWKFGVSFGIVTPSLRVAAHRHTKTQVFVGSLIGIGSDFLGHLLHCEGV